MRIMPRSLVSLLLAGAILLPFTACSPAEPGEETTDTTADTTVMETTTEETTAAETEPPIPWLDFFPVKEEKDPAVARPLSANLVKNEAVSDEPDQPRIILDPTAEAHKTYAKTEYTKTMAASYVWYYNHASFSFPLNADLSAYKAYSFWVYVPEESVGATFYMYFNSQNPDTDGMDYYGKQINLSAAGWNYFSGSMADFSISRTPKGWDQIDALCLTSTGWSQHNDTSTVIYLDAFRLHTNPNAVASSSGMSVGDAFAFSLGGPRAMYDTDTVEISYIDDTSVVTEENGVVWLPLSVFGAVLGEGDYTASTKTMNLTFGGKTYTFVGGKNTVTVNGKSEKLDFTVKIIGDSLFVPMEYAAKLFGYGEIYRDTMDIIILSKDKREYDLHTDLTGLLSVAYTTLFSRPSGEEILADMYENHGGDVHPRVMLTKDDFDTLRTYYKTDKEFQRFVLNVEQRYGLASKEFGANPATYTIADGVRLLPESRRAKNRILPWCALYQITGKKSYAARAWQEVQALVTFKDWHPSHYLDTAEILYPMAIAYDWLYDYLTDEQKKQMEEATLKFGLMTGLDRYEGRAGRWGDNNWNGVCNGGLVAAAIAYSAVYPEECEAILGYAITDIEKGLYQYAPDGGYLESPGYWSYGTDYTHVMISSLDSACGTDYGLYNSPGFAESAYFTAYFETEIGCWGFHDSSSSVSDTNCLSWFAKKSKDPSINRLRYNDLLNGVKSYNVYDLIWYDPTNVSETVELNLDAFYSEVGAATMRSTWEEGALFTGLHGGDNAVNHGDLDIGNFVLDGAGKRFIVELGSDEYNMPGYFGNTRWQYYRKRAEGQNTLIIGDVMYTKADQTANAIAGFDRVENNDTSSIAIVDMTPAYAAMETGKRGLFFTDDRSTIILQDEVKLKSAETVRWQAHTKGIITITETGRTAFIRMGEYFLYCEIVSEDASLRFSSGTADSYDASYKNDPTEYKRGDFKKLMVITDEKVTDFQCAIVFKVIPMDGLAPAMGTTYTWTDMADWKLN